MELLRLQCENDAAAEALPNSASWTSSSSVLAARRSAALEKEVEHLRWQLDQVKNSVSTVSASVL